MDVLMVLQESGVDFQPSGSDDWINISCPFHADDRPSCGINVQSGKFKCHAAGCGESGSFDKLFAKLQGVDLSTAKLMLVQQYGMGIDDKLIDPSVAQRHHNRLLQEQPESLLNELRKRGITERHIKQYTIGYDGERIIIPIYAIHGGLVNLRKYLPHAKIKFQNHRGYGKIQLYPIGQIVKNFDSYVICGGELKCIVAADEVNEHGIGAISTTAGEGKWHRRFNQHVAGKTVYICMDPDEGGKQASLDLAAAMLGIADRIFIVDLPEPPERDLSDFKADGKLLYPLLETAREYEAMPTAGGIGWPSEAIAEAVPFASALGADYVGRRLEVKAQVVAFDDNPYAVPRDIEVLCDKSQDFCVMCPVMKGGQDGHKQTVPTESRHILKMVETADANKDTAVKEAVGIPVKCKVCQIKELTRYQVEAVRLSPEISLHDQNDELNRENIPAFLVDSFVESNETYQLQGRPYTDPKSQSLVFLFSHVETAADNLSSYKVAEMDRLKLFRPDSWTPVAVRNKLYEIYDDFEANVTRIYKRKELHLAVDLVYHSPLWLDFGGKRQKGWLEALILGDSGQGKTETVLRMLEHYNLGVKVDCKNVSTAGLVGGVQRFERSGKWYVTWGIIPLHDKRLVILEELKGAKPEVISSLTEMRSSGIADISKIGKRRARARTRLIALSNPRSTRAIRDFTYGIEAITELVGSQEDVRRFDFALIVSEADVDSQEYTELLKNPPQCQHVYTQDLCRDLILWSWTIESVVYEDEAKNMIYNYGRQFAETYQTDIWLIDQSTMPTKLARMSAAIAARTFSCSDDAQQIIVRPCHVQFIVDWLTMIYSSESSGYLNYAKQRKQRSLDEELVAECLKQADPRYFVDMMLQVDDFNLNEFRSYFNWDELVARTIFSQLLQANAFRPVRGRFIKTAEFNTWLRSVAGKMPEEIPDYLKEKY